MFWFRNINVNTLNKGDYLIIIIIIRRRRRRKPA
jgi:hypothetical protein